MEDKWEKVIWWFIKNFFITAKEKEEHEKYKTAEEKKRKQTRKAKGAAEERRKDLIEKYQIIPTEDRIYVGEKNELRVGHEDFMKIILEEGIMKFLTFVPPANGDTGIYADCPYYFYLNGICVVTEASVMDDGIIKNFLSLFFDTSSIRLCRKGKKNFFGWSVEKIIVLSSTEELRKFLTKEVSKQLR